MFFVFLGSVVFSHPVEATNFLSVSVTPNTAGDNAEYHIYGCLSEWDNVSLIDVHFQYNTTVLYDYAPLASVIVNNNIVASVQYIKNVDYSLDAIITLKNPLNKGDTIDILFKKEAGIVNQTIPAEHCYKLKLIFLNSKGEELGFLSSNPYEIVHSVIHNLTVSVKNPVAGSTTSYTISFYTGVGGDLEPISGEIRIIFPEGTIFTKNNYIDRAGVLVNGVKARVVLMDLNNYLLLRIYPAEPIKANSQVKIFISDTVGIANPSVSGRYVLSVATFAEPTPVQFSYDVYSSFPFSDLFVSCSSYLASSNVSIHIDFITLSTFSYNDYLYVAFPNFYIPSVILRGSVLVNGNVVEVHVFQDRIFIPVFNISSGSRISIEILDTAGIKLPNKSGEYIVSLWSGANKMQIGVNIYVAPVPMSRINVICNNFYPFSSNSLRFSFITGSDNIIFSNEEIIEIDFGSSFVLPDQLVPSAIKINNVPAYSVVKNGNNNSILVLVPIDINPLSNVVVDISKSFGIKNSDIVDKFFVKFSILWPANKIESDIIEIKESEVANW